MPDLTSQASTFRRGGHNFTGYVSTPPQTVVLAGTITSVPTYPAKTLSYTLDSGSAANALGDLTVNFYSSGGTKKATLRIATGTASTSSVLQVAEFAKGVYDVAVNDTFEVVKAWSIWDRLVSATSALNKDSRITYADQGANPNPVANSGGAVAGVNTSIDFDGSDSFVVGPDSSSLTHSWDFGDGTPSTSSSASPTSVFPAGFRWVKHTVTDSDNSKSTIQYIPVWVHDSTYPALAVQVDSLGYSSHDQGWQCSFKLPSGSEGDIANLPDGSLIVYWERERYAGNEASYGSAISGRSQVKFVGYLVRDSIHIDPDSNEVAFEAVSPLAILALTPALPQLMVSKTSPTKWSQVKSLSTKKMFWYLSYWHSSLQDVFDFVWNDGLDISFTRIAVEGQSIAEQLRDIANGLNLQVTCDRLGRILFTRDPDFLTGSERSSRTKTYDFTTADVMEIDIPRDHRGSVKFVRGEGITSGNKPVFSNSPGNAPAPYGTGSDTLSKQIVTSQSDLNTRTGYHFARVNGLYNGQFVPKGVRVKLPDGYDVFDPALREFITLTLSASLNSRGVGFDTTTRWTVEQATISYDIEAGAKDIEITVDHETIGVAGITYIPPQETDNGLPPIVDIPPLDLSFPDITTDTGTGIGTGGGVVAVSSKGLAAFCTDNHLYITHDFNTPEASDGPDWDTDVDLTGLTNWGGGDLISFCADPYSAAYVTSGATQVDGWIVTTTHVQKIIDIFGTVALETATALHDTSSKRTLLFSRKTKNFGIIATWYDDEGVYAAVTTDGDSWTEGVVTTDYLTTGGGLAPGIHLSNVITGKARISVWTATDDPMAPSDATASVYQTLNSGSSWSLLASPSIDSGDSISSTLVIPFKNKSETVFYHRKHSTADGIQLIRHMAGVETDITPGSDGITYPPVGEFSREFAMSDHDDNTLAVVGIAGGGAAAWTLGTRFGAGGALMGTIVEQTSEYLIIDSVDDGAGSQAVFITSGSPDICCVPSAEFLSGGYTVLGALDCGAAIDEWGFSWTGATPVWYVDYAAPVGSPFTVKITFDCGGAGLSYGVFLTKNAKADEPDWIALTSPSEADYREVYALSAKSFLLTGVNGAIAMATNKEGSVDSRKGNLSTTGRICGIAGN